jgi:cytochrome bd-type quinol oxidase subunit 2
MHRSSLTALRGALGVLLVGTVLVQLLLPLAAGELGGGYRETEHLVGPYAAMGILTVACLQIAVGALWWMLRPRDDDRTRTRTAVRGLDVLTACAIAATAIPALTMLHLLIVVGVGGPGIVLGTVACLATGAALTLRLRAARRAFRTAMATSTDLAAVT